MDTTNTLAPSYLVAADVHNMGNSNTSWFDPNTWVDKVGSAGKFAAVSMLSGVNSFYNSAAQVGNWLGADTQQRETSAWISSLDSDFGQYYRQNKQYADLTGFVITSLVPGFAGVKIFNAGQKALMGAVESGFIGGNLAKATGLLLPNAQKYVALATTDINSSLAATGLTNANTLRAIASGFGQNALEAAAFETVVQATMFKAPTLQDQTVSDIAVNIATGGLVGGAIGGAFQTASIFGQLRKGRNVEDYFRFPITQRPGFASATPASEKIIQLHYDSEMAAVPVAIKNADGTEIINNFAVTKSLYQSKIEKNFNEARTNIHSLTSRDIELGNVVANLSTPTLDSLGNLVPGFAEQAFQNFSGAVKFARANEITTIESTVAKALKEGKVDVPKLGFRWVKNMGEDAGQITDELPAVLSLGDLYKGKGEILRAVKKEGFNLKTLWDAETLTAVKGHLEAEKRYIWAHNSVTKIPDGTLIHANDIPLLERAYDLGQSNIKIVKGEGPSLEVTTPSSLQDLYEHIKNVKQSVAENLHLETGWKKGADVNVNADMIAKIVNVRRSYLEGAKAINEVDDLFANQTAKRQYLETFTAKGLSLKAPEAIDPLFLPKYTKTVYDISKDVASTNESVLDAITYYKAQQQIYVDGNKRVATQVLGQHGLSLPDFTDTALINTNRGGAGGGLWSYKNSNYGTVGSSTQQIGSITREVEQVKASNISKRLEAPLTRLAAKPEAAMEFESVNQKVTRSSKLWILAEDSTGDWGLVEQKTAKANNLNDIGNMDKYGNKLDKPQDIIVDFEALDETNHIPLKYQETIDVIKAHIDETGLRTIDWKQINAQRGHTDFKSPDVYRPIRPDLSKYPYVAFVKDPKVTGAGHTTLLHAASEKELAALASQAETAGYQVVTKSAGEDYFKAAQTYEYARTLNENYINTDLVNKGIYSNFFPKTDPQKIVNDILQQHLKESSILVKEAVRLRYEPEFSLFEDFGKQYAQFATSKFASRTAALEKTANNPYFNLIKTALNISETSEHPLIYSFNKELDSGVSKMWGALRDTFAGVKSPEELGKINAILDEYGMKPAYYTAGLNALANHEAPQAVLTKFVRAGNSLLSLFTLGLDWFNSINNFVGANFLRMTELKSIQRAIAEGNTALAGDLAKLAKIKLPGVDSEILSPTKLVANAFKAYWSEDLKGPLMAKYKLNGFIKDRAEMLRLLAEDFTLKGSETVSELGARQTAGFLKAKKLAEFGETYTGNKLAEELNRFISANVMDQITTLGVKHGVMDERTALSYINTFVNRVEGNTVASQRPLIFQGPIGQAVGLFQSFQFNMMQQMFRYVAEGSKKDVAMLLGLQSTLYGIQGLPAFQFINTHIVGKLSGNLEHRDAYDSIYGVAGKTAGDFILYGLPSNILQGNLYSRGDINPRQVTILPTSLQETPIVQGWGKFLGSMYDTLGKIKGGANIWESVLQGMEHNGISRPLAGFAQTLQAFGPGGEVYSTSGKGSILYSNDLASWATIVRMAGARPLDEAVVNDKMFRVKSYEAARKADRNELAERIKTTQIQGQTASNSQIEYFAEQYARLGGKQAGFNKWMMELYKNANVSQAQQLEMNLKSPYSQDMQLLMGGETGD